MAGERVLVVEDSQVYRDLVVDHVLKPAGYEPLVARDGEAGLNTALQESPDLMIIDMQMPGLTGIQVLEALHEAGRDIPVILMTLHGSEDLVVRAFRMGVKDYVIKPFSVDEMLSAIDRALTEVRLRRERDTLTEEFMRTNQQQEGVLTNTVDAVLLVDENDTDQVILANWAARRAFDMGDDVTSRRLAEVANDEVLIDVFERARIEAKPTRAEIALPDGRTLNAHVTPIPGVGRVAVMQDITYLKELDRMRSEFVSTASHDLRSPLTSIKGFADLLPKAGPLNEQQELFLEKIQRGVDNIAQLVANLLDLGRIEAVGEVISVDEGGFMPSVYPVRLEEIDGGIDPAYVTRIISYVEEFRLQEALIPPRLEHHGLIITFFKVLLDRIDQFLGFLAIKIADQGADFNTGKEIRKKDRDDQDHP